jgi:hypothetical protein
MATLNLQKEEPVNVAVLANLDPHDALRRAPKVKIRVHKTGQPNESQDVYVGVNGIGFQIKRGEEVTVPEPVMLVLKDAVRTVFRWVVDADGTLRQEGADVLAYPFDRLN